MSLYLNNLTGKFSLVVLQWVTHRSIQRAHVAMSHILQLTQIFPCLLPRTELILSGLPEKFLLQVQNDVSPLPFHIE